MLRKQLVSIAINILLLIGVYSGIEHYTGHHCIAVSAVCGLLYLVGTLKGRRR